MRDGEVQAHRQIEQQRAKLFRERSRSESKAKQALFAMSAHDTARRKASSLLSEALRRIERTAEAAEAASRNRLTQSRSNLQSERARLTQAEANELQAATASRQGKIAAFKSELNDLQRREQQDAASALQSLQDQHVRTYMTRFKIAEASIPGIGDTLKNRLTAAGIYTAADADSHRVSSVSGIGDQKGAAIRRWRASAQAQASASLPTSLPRHELTAIQNRYSSRASVLRAEIRQIELQRDVTKAGILAKFSRQKDAVDASLEQASAAFEKEVSDLKTDAERQKGTAVAFHQKDEDEALMRKRDLERSLASARGEENQLAYRIHILDRKARQIRVPSIAKWVWANLVGSQ